MAYQPPRSGSPLTAAALESMAGEGADYTPTWASGGTAPSVGNGTLAGRRILMGDIAIVTIKLTGGSSTNWGTGNYSFSLPADAPAAATADIVGTCFVGDSSVGGAGYSTGVAFVGAGGTTVGAYIGAKNAASAISNTNPQTMATGDRIWLFLIYEVA